MLKETLMHQKLLQFLKRAIKLVSNVKYCRCKYYRCDYLCRFKGGSKTGGNHSIQDHYQRHQKAVAAISDVWVGGIP